MPTRTKEGQVHYPFVLQRSLRDAASGKARSVGRTLPAVIREFLEKFVKEAEPPADDSGKG